MEKQKTVREVRRTEATKMVEDFVESGANLAKVVTSNTDNPYSIFITMRRNIVKLGLEDQVKTFVKHGDCYLKKL